VIFTSDHGEMLGAHAMRNKANFLEEAIRVPLMISFPDQIAPGTEVDTPVSHLDLFATIMDYLGTSKLDKGDGSSLRRFIEKTSFNEEHDEETVVSELEFRVPTSNKGLSGELGDMPNYVIRKGSFKLMLPKSRTSNVLDMMYDLRADAYEQQNLLPVLSGKKNPSKELIGKAEHLKALLLDWMKRMDGRKGYFSKKKFNGREGLGDIEEIRQRRTWPTVNFWRSDRELRFGEPALVDGYYVRNEYLYFGRSNPGVLNLTDIRVEGSDAEYFSLDTNRYDMRVSDSGKYARIKVTFRSTDNPSMKSLDAKIIANVNGKPTQLTRMGAAEFW
jgi:hypothetical protein